MLNVKQGEFTGSAVSTCVDTSTECAGKVNPGQVEKDKLLVTETVGRFPGKAR